MIVVLIDWSVVMNNISTIFCFYMLFENMTVDVKFMLDIILILINSLYMESILYKGMW